MSRSDPQFKLRLPVKLKDRIEKEAKQQRRSINAEIISRLELSYSIDDAIEATDKDWEEGKLKHSKEDIPLLLNGISRNTEIIKEILSNEK